MLSALGCDNHQGEVHVLEQRISVLAARRLNEVVQQIKDDQWSMTLPPDFQTMQGATVTLREVLDYHTYDDAWVPDMLAGKTMAEVGEAKYKEDLLGENPKQNFEQYAERACVAIEALDDAERTVHCSFGDFTAREYLWQVASFRGLRSYDIAKAIGVDPTLSDELVEGLWEIIAPHADEWRAYGVYPPAIPVSADAPLLTKLLATTGRQP